jgi:hypothetical protein
MRWEERYGSSPEGAGVEPVGVSTQHCVVERLSGIRRLKKLARVGEVAPRCLYLRRIVGRALLLVPSDHRCGLEVFGDIKGGEPVVDAADTNAIADLGLGMIVPPPGRIYASLVRGRLTWPDPSELAQSDAAMKELWVDSAYMVGMLA